MNNEGKNGIDSSKKDEQKDKKKKEEDEEKSSEPPPVGLFELFRFSTPLDTFLIIFGLTIAFSCGSCMPILCILFGDTLQSFVDATTIQQFNMTHMA